MKIFVVGATGATGRLLVEMLLKRGHQVCAVLRSADKLPQSIRNHEHITVIQAGILDLSDDEMAQHVKNCDAIASCLGHNANFKGIYGQPRLLVSEATRRLCTAVTDVSTKKIIRFILMNTAGNSNRDLKEPISLSQRLVIGLLRLLLPPHVDNEKAADYLRTQVGQHHSVIEWSVVRPDNLINQDVVTEYEVFPSPIRSAIFDAGTTSRINVADFMSRLITDNDLWAKWKGQMPVIYNKASSSFGK